MRSELSEVRPLSIRSVVSTVFTLAARRGGQEMSIDSCGRRRRRVAYQPSIHIIIIIIVVYRTALLLLLNTNKRISVTPTAAALRSKCGYEPEDVAQRRLV